MSGRPNGSFVGDQVSSYLFAAVWAVASGAAMVIWALIRGLDLIWIVTIGSVVTAAVFFCFWVWPKLPEAARTTISALALIGVAALVIYSVPAAVRYPSVVERAKADADSSNARLARLSTRDDEIKSLKQRLASRTAEVTKDEKRNVPPVNKGSWPFSFQPPVNQAAVFRIASYKGRCDSLPAGQECMHFQDGYVMLVYDHSDMSSMDSSPDGPQVEGRTGKYATYRHTLGTDLFVVSRVWNQPVDAHATCH